MDPFQILFDRVSNLTGGLISDVQTAMLAVLTLFITLIGLDMIKTVVFVDDLYGRLFERNASKWKNNFKDDWEAARYFNKRMKWFKQGTVEYDVAMARYRKHLKNIV